jgi:L-lysine exporter family protein LysE/ArgO
MTTTLAEAFLQGLVLAFGLILPLGPQNMFVLNQGINHRRWRRALPVALAAGACDTLLIVLAVTGVSLAVLAVRWLNLALTVIGIAFLAYMGWVSWRNAGAATGDIDVASAAWPARRQLSFAVSVSLLNPHAILDTVAVIGPTSLSYPAGQLRLAFTGAVVLNSWLWYLGLITIGHVLRSSQRVRVLQVWMNRASAAVMWYSAFLLLRRLIG